MLIQISGQAREVMGVPDVVWQAGAKLNWSVKAGGKRKSSRPKHLREAAAGTYLRLVRTLTARAGDGGMFSNKHVLTSVVEVLGITLSVRLLIARPGLRLGLS